MVHLQENRYSVDIIDLSEEELIEVKKERGVPSGLTSCHTAEIGGYIVEGHVPADVVEKVLKEKPEIVGVAVAGMPEGSPGMGGELQEPLQVMAFNSEGESWLYVEYQDGILD